VDYIPVKVDEINNPSTALRRKQRKAWKSSIGVTSTQPGAGSLKFDLFDRGHRSSAARSLLGFIQIVYETIIIQFLHETQVSKLFRFGSTRFGILLPQFQ